jgi:hypothetical protein
MTQPVEMAARVADDNELEAQNIHIDIAGNHEQNNKLAGLDPTSGTTFMHIVITNFTYQIQKAWATYPTSGKHIDK